MPPAVAARYPAHAAGVAARRRPSKLVDDAAGNRAGLRLVLGGRRRHVVLEQRFVDLDDEDEHGLEDYLQAACFLESGKTWVPAKPWERERDGVWVEGQVQLLSKEAQRLVAMLSREK